MVVRKTLLYLMRRAMSLYKSRKVVVRIVDNNVDKMWITTGFGGSKIILTLCKKTLDKCL